MAKRKRRYERATYAVHSDHIEYVLRMAFRRKISMSELIRDILDAHMKMNPLQPKRITKQ